MIRSDAQSPNLDLLRAMAVTFVVVSHLWDDILPTQPRGYHVQALGFLGVLIFFVHTSLVLMLSLERQGAQSGGGRLLAQFIARRIFRIYPLSVTIVCVTYLLSLIGLGPELDRHLPDFVYNLLLVQNITGTPSNPAPLWSLPYEMQMYFALPGVFAMVSTKRARGPLVAVVLWLGAMLSVFAVWSLRWDYGLIKFIPCFIPGVLAYAMRGRSEVRAPTVVLFSFVVLVAVSYPAAVARGIPENLLGPFVCLALGALIPISDEITNHTLQRLGKVIAQYSYGVYLTHSLCIWLAFHIGARMPLVMRMLIFSGSLFLLSWLAYRLIEVPGQRLGKRLAEALRRQGRQRGVGTVAK